MLRIIHPPWTIWQFLKVPGKDGEYKSIPGSWENDSGYFPLWQMSYMIIGGYVGVTWLTPYLSGTRRGTKAFLLHILKISDACSLSSML